MSLRLGPASERRCAAEHRRRLACLTWDFLSHLPDWAWAEDATDSRGIADVWPTQSAKIIIGQQSANAGLHLFIALTGHGDCNGRALATRTTLGSGAKLILKLGQNHLKAGALGRVHLDNANESSTTGRLRARNMTQERREERSHAQAQHH